MEECLGLLVGEGRGEGATLLEPERWIGATTIRTSFSPSMPLPNTNDIFV